MHKLLLLFVLFCGSRVIAQGRDTTMPRIDSTNPVVVEKDPRIDQLVRKQVEINEVTTRETRRYVQGFRIQVMNSPDRAKVFAAKARVFEQFPDWKPYL